MTKIKSGALLPYGGDLRPENLRPLEKITPVEDKREYDVLVRVTYASDEPATMDDIWKDVQYALNLGKMQHAQIFPEELVEVEEIDDE